MNPLTNMKNVQKLSEQELQRMGKSSWHDQYRDSAWIFVGGIPYDLTEGDVICIFSQFGEIVNINLIRDKDTGKSKGFCFICYEDQRSTILAVDNFNGIKILNRIIRVDHVSDYKAPKDGKKVDPETKKLRQEGCAPKAQPPPPLAAPMVMPPQDLRETLADQITADIKLPPRLPIYSVKEEPKTPENKEEMEIKKEKTKDRVKEKKRKKKHKKDKKKSKKRKKSYSSEESLSDTNR